MPCNIHTDIAALHNSVTQVTSTEGHIYSASQGKVHCRVPNFQISRRIVCHLKSSDTNAPYYL